MVSHLKLSRVLRMPSRAETGREEMRKTLMQGFQGFLMVVMLTIIVIRLTG